MCVALPGIVEKIEEKTAVVDFSGNKVNAFAGFCEVAVGDRVLVHAGCILQVVSQTQAEEIESILKDMEDVMPDGRIASQRDSGLPGAAEYGASP